MPHRDGCCLCTAPCGIRTVIPPTKTITPYKPLYIPFYPFINWGAWLGWSLTLYCPMGKAGQMTIGKTLPRLEMGFRNRQKLVFLV